MYIITAKHKGNKITRKAVSDTQASAIINQLLREGCTEIGIKEEKRNATEGICFIQKKVTESDPGKIAGHSEQGSEDQVFPFQPDRAD